MNDEAREGVGWTLAALALLAGLLGWLALAGCSRAQYVPVETVRRDSICLTQIQRDSIYKYDSIHVRDKGDTVFVDRYKYLFVDKLRRDTLYVCRTDTVRVPYPVERELTAWQCAKLEAGAYSSPLKCFVSSCTVIAFPFRYLLVVEMSWWRAWSRATTMPTALARSRMPESFRL